MYNKKQIEYSKKYNKKKNKFYVYVYLDPRKEGEFIYGEYKFNYEPFYIGKGSGVRDKMHLNEYNLNLLPSYKNNKIKKILSIGLSPIIIRVENNMFENDAFNLETKLITLIGRSDLGTGPLTNLTNGGDGTSGYKFTDELLSKKKVKIKQFSLTGDFIKEWDSIISIKNTLSSKNSGSISDVCKLKRFSLFNFIWRYSDDIENISNIKNYIINYYDNIYKIRSLNGKSNNKEIIECDINSREIKKWSSLAEASDYYGISSTAIINSIRKCWSCINKFWSYSNNFDYNNLIKLIDNYNLKVNVLSNKRKNMIDKNYKSIKGKSVQQFKDGQLIKTWSSITDVNKHLGIQIGNITKVCNKERKQAGGYSWEWLNK